MTSTALQTALLLLREGIEAFLVVTAIITCVIGPGEANRKYAIWIGVFVALLAATVGAWLLSDLHFQLRHSLAEAIGLLLIAALMLQISGWLFFQPGAFRWNRYLQSRATALRASDLWLAAIVCVAVFREACELALFLYAMTHMGTVDHAGIALGLLAGGVVLVPVCVAFWKMVSRLPIKLIFLATSAVLFVSAIKLVGTGLENLQSLGYLSRTVWTSGEWFGSLGLNPSWEAIGVQVAIVLASGFAFAHAARRMPEQAATLRRPGNSVPSSDDP